MLAIQSKIPTSVADIYTPMITKDSGAVITLIAVFVLLAAVIIAWIYLFHRFAKEGRNH